MDHTSGSADPRKKCEAALNVEPVGLHRLDPYRFTVSYEFKAGWNELVWWSTYWCPL